MPENFAIALFVFGAVLFLIALLGGGFKIFAAEVSGTTGRAGRVVAGMAGTIFMVMALVQVLPQRSQQADSHPGAEKPAPPLSISGVWQGNTGSYTVTQEGRRLVWDGIGRFGNTVWHHRGEGTVDGYTIRAAIEELQDSNFPGPAGGSPVEGSIAIDGQTISWTGMNDQERVWRRMAISR